MWVYEIVSVCVYAHVHTCVYAHMQSNLETRSHVAQVGVELILQ